MILDVYYEPEMTLTIPIGLKFLFVGILLLFITIEMIVRYKKASKKDVKKRKIFKIVSIILGLLTLTCIGLYIYLDYYVASNIIEKHPHVSWSSIVDE